MLILDDFAYVSKDQAESSVLFELISVRYDQRSSLITANQPLEQWHKVFPDVLTAVAAVDRLVHHAIILEIFQITVSRSGRYCAKCISHSEHN